jgi:hypothetical protein
MRQFSIVLGALGLLAGFVLAMSVLSGDAQGRVNLLYLLLLFVFLPVFSLLLSIVFLVKKSARGLAGLLLELPIWPARVRQEALALAPGVERKYWLFYQTQLLSLTFAIGGLVAFLLLLVGTDISFVWRSTLLQATDLLPVLELLSTPWAFWGAAQPSLTLLQQSQDFRLATPELTAAQLGQWWKYAFAAQVTYMLAPRAIMALIARAVYLGKRDTAEVSGSRKVVHVDSLNTVPMQGHLAPLVKEVRPDYLLVDWGSVPLVLAEALYQRIGKPGEIVRAGPLSESNPEKISKFSGAAIVVAVKAWEPPMGELQDYLQALPAGEETERLLLPLDWNNEGLLRVRSVDLQEWRRFCGTLGGWSVLQSDAASGELS